MRRMRLRFVIAAAVAATATYAAILRDARRRAPSAPREDGPGADVDEATAERVSGSVFLTPTGSESLTDPVVNGFGIDLASTGSRRTPIARFACRGRPSGTSMTLLDATSEPPSGAAATDERDAGQIRPDRGDSDAPARKSPSETDDDRGTDVPFRPDLATLRFTFRRPGGLAGEPDAPSDPVIAAASSPAAGATAADASVEPRLHDAGDVAEVAPTGGEARAGTRNGFRRSPEPVDGPRGVPSTGALAELRRLARFVEAGGATRPAAAETVATAPAAAPPPPVTGPADPVTSRSEAPAPTLAPPPEEPASATEAQETTAEPAPPDPASPVSPSRSGIAEMDIPSPVTGVAATGEFSIAGTAYGPGQGTITAVTYRHPLDVAVPGEGIELHVADAVNVAVGGLFVMDDEGFAPDVDGFVLMLLPQDAGAFSARGTYHVRA